MVGAEAELSGSSCLRLERTTDNVSERVRLLSLLLFIIISYLLVCVCVIS